MKTVNLLISFLLAIATAFVGLFWLGDAEQHKLLLETAFWSTFWGRFLTIALVGSVGSGVWLLVNMGLKRTGLIENVRIGQTTLILLSGPIIGAFLGAVVFCFV